MWMRRIRLELTSNITGKVMIFDTYDEEKKRQKDSLSITISGSKSNALMRDKGIITITNLPYDKILEIIEYEYYTIDIYAGYLDTGLTLIHSGGVSYISKKIFSHHDEETYICYASKFVAKYSQERMKFYFNSSINIYAALSYMQNETNMRVSMNPELKQRVLDHTTELNGSITTILDAIMSEAGGDYTLDTDYIDSNVINITKTEDKRRINLDERYLSVAKGNPTLSTEGLDIYLLPAMDYKIGDIIHIPNAIIDMSIASADVTSTFTSNYVDTNGEYMIYKLDYTLQNRGSEFIYHVKARALSVIKNLTGTDL